MLENRAPTPSVPCEELVTGFDHYLLEVRGLLPSTRAVYGRHILQFLATQFPSGTICNIRELHPRDIFGYISMRAGQGSPHRTKMDVCVLRSFLRYLVVSGNCDQSLIAGVPSVPTRKLAHLPKVLSNEAVTALLKSFDRDTPTGRRNFAMALCIIRLGLRAGEVAALSLDDIDWRSGSISIRTPKGRRTSIIPLPGDVGEALTDYLQWGRPATDHRYLFVQHPRGRHPGKAMTAPAVRGAISQGWQRTGHKVPSRGTHALRHTLASNMLREGADLKIIADTLRHRSLDTTMIYTKVDFIGLADVIQPWPEVTT